MTPTPIELLDAVAADTASASTSLVPVPRSHRSAPRPGIGRDAKARARVYLLQIGPAVAGEHGNKRTYIAARVAWNDFGLPEADAWDVLLDFNRSCQPPWEEADLRRILRSAIKKGPCSKGRGWRFDSRQNGAPESLHPAAPNAESDDHLGPHSNHDAVADEQRPEDDAARGWRFRPVSSATFAAGDYRTTWLVDRVLVKGQPAVVGGPPKALKTSILVDLAISLASGTRFLGAFDATKQQRVCFVSGESGHATLQETAIRVCKAKSAKLEDLELYWMCDLPQLANPKHLDELQNGLEEYEADVLILDPLYLCLLAGGNDTVDERSLYQMGEHLRRVARVCEQVGTTPIFAHHANRGLKRGETMELQHLSYAGIAEFARQWLLVNRATAYDGDGVHDLIMSFGGSAGQSGVWSLRIEERIIEADLSRRSWVVTALPASEAREAAKVQKANTREAEQLKKRLAQDSRVLEALDKICLVERAATKTQLSGCTRMSPKVVSEVVTRLLESESLETVTFEKPSGKSGKSREYQGYRRANQTANSDQPDLGTGADQRTDRSVT